MAVQQFKANSPHSDMFSRPPFPREEDSSPMAPSQSFLPAGISLFFLLWPPPLTHFKFCLSSKVTNDYSLITPYYQPTECRGQRKSGNRVVIYHFHLFLCHIIYVFLRNVVILGSEEATTLTNFTPMLVMDPRFWIHFVSWSTRLMLIQSLLLYESLFHLTEVYEESNRHKSFGRI